MRKMERSRMGCGILLLNVAVALSIVLLNNGCGKKDERSQPDKLSSHAEDLGGQDKGNAFHNATTNAEAPFNRAKTLDTVEAYQEYIRKYPQGTHVSEARDAIDRLHFNVARDTKSIDAYEKYLKTNPEGKHRNEALDGIDALIKNDVLTYLGYIQGTSNIERICDADLRGMCLSFQGTMDVGTKFLDLYCDEKVAIAGVAGKGLGVLFLDDTLSIAYKGGRIVQMKNRDKEQYRKYKETAARIEESGLTFETTVNGVKASRTYCGGG